MTYTTLPAATSDLDFGAGFLTEEPTHDAAGPPGPRGKIVGTHIASSRTHVSKKQHLYLVSRPRRVTDQPGFDSTEAASVIGLPDESQFAEAATPLTPRPPMLSDEFGDYEPFVDEEVIGRFLGLEPRRILEMARAQQITSHPIGDIRKTWRFRISEVAADFDRLKKPVRATMPAAVPGTKERNQLG